MLDYASLSAVAVVVREGSFERAARALSVTPSAISQRGKQLDDSLGTWFIKAMAAFLTSDRTLLNVAIDDQEHTQQWLRAGDVLAAVTADSRALQGCDSVALGKLKYCAVASR